MTWEWTKKCEEAFRDLKTALANPPITAFLDFTLPFCLYTDGSDLGLGAVLAKYKMIKNMSSPTSRTLSLRKHYSATKK